MPWASFSIAYPNKIFAKLKKCIMCWRIDEVRMWPYHLLQYAQGPMAHINTHAHGAIDMSSFAAYYVFCMSVNEFQNGIWQKNVVSNKLLRIHEHKHEHWATSQEISSNVSFRRSICVVLMGVATIFSECCTQNVNCTIVHDVNGSVAENVDMLSTYTNALLCIYIVCVQCLYKISI